MALVTVRQLASLPHQHFWVVNRPSEQCVISTRTKEGGVVRKITREELRVHNVVGNGANKKDDLWVLVNGKVYDMSKFYRNHPGGPDIIEEWAGKDGTKVFEDAGHPKNSKKEMETYMIGEYKEPK